jgi:hypothetical protein
VTKAIRNLEKLGVVREKTGRRRIKIYVYSGFLAILEEGAGPIG